MKTLADLLCEDGAREGDVYEAVGQRWILATDINNTQLLQTNEWDEVLLPSVWRYIPADGWNRVSRKPRVVEFEDVVSNYPHPIEGCKVTLADPRLNVLSGKRVKVTVEEILE